MLRSSKVPVLLTGLHTVILLFAAYHFARFLSPVLSHWFLMGLGVAAAAVTTAIERTRLRLIPATLLFAALLLAARGLLEIVVQIWRTLGSQTSADAVTLFVDTSGMAALPVVLLLWFSVFLLNRNPAAYRWHPVILAPVIVVLFWTQGAYNLSLYDHPLSYALVVAVFVLLEVALLLLAFRAGVDGESTGRRPILRGVLTFILIVLPLVFLAGSLLYSQYAEGSTARGGGLLEPTLFRFDFSDYLRLESEISLSDELVLFLKKPPTQGRSYLRRYVLSSYDQRRGFFQDDSSRVPQEVGNSPQAYPDPGYEAREGVEQEVYLVNFDPDSLVALNYPVQVVPFRAWPDASFSRVYRVTSRVSRAGRLELVSVGEPRVDSAAQYTDHGGNEAIAELAREITAGIDNPYDQVAAIEAHLRDEYFYSLSPGVASDGNQLMHFLFESQKGYCSYFAFAMSLMVRSLDIPARVSVGFYVDPRLQVLDFHVIRADMAHAWVEVYFNEYGWIEFDPTSETVAPGEDVELGGDVQINEIAALLEEILQNRGGLTPLEADPQRGAATDADRSALAAAARLAQKWWPLILAALALAVLAGRHALLAGLLGPTDSERAVIRRYRRLLLVAGYLGWPRRRGESILEHAERVHQDSDAPLARAAELYLAALFARPGSLAGVTSFTATEKQTRAVLWRRAPRRMKLRFILLPFGRPAGRARRGSAVRSLLLLGAGLALLFAPVVVQAQETRPGAPRDAWDGEDYAGAVEEAVRGERFDHALSLLEEAKERYPAHLPLYLIAGDLYRDEELYEMALAEYRQAARLDPDSYAALHGQSVALGRLNREREAIDVLQRLIGHFPDSVEAISDLGWLYFKTHQLAKGEALLTDALDRVGMNRSLAMTLATVYADMYEYDEAKRYYELAIQDAKEDGRSYFASVAEYNLSLVEKTFYNFDAALASTQESLRLARRAPGLLARGELHERRLRYSDALSDYNAAFALDEETPLAQVSLASLSQTFGRLDEALAYAKDVYDSDDTSWMFNFGTDLTRHGLDMHGLMADIYEGLYHRTAFEPVDGVGEWFGRLIRRIGYRVRAWFHRRNERMFARDVAEAYEEEGSTLNANWTYYRAYEDYPGKAAGYLARARAFETGIIPESSAFYAMQEGALRGDVERLEEAAARFDPLWERIERAQAARELAELRKQRGEGERYARAVRELYALNPGGLRQHGLSMPVDLELSIPGFDGTSYTRLAASLGNTGLPTVRPGVAAFRLVITGDGSSVLAALYDGDRLVRSGRHRLPGLSRRQIRALAASIADGVFRVQ